MVFSGEVYMVPIMVPMLPARLTPRTTHGFVAMRRKAKPDLKSDRAARAVTARPPPAYMKLSWRYDCSAGERPSLVSRLKNAFTATMVPATVTYKHDVLSPTRPEANQH